MSYEGFTETFGDRTFWPEAFEQTCWDLPADTGIGFDAVCIDLEAKTPRERARAIDEMFTTDHSFLDFLARRRNEGVRPKEHGGKGLWADLFYHEYCKFVSFRYELGESPLPDSKSTTIVAGRAVDADGLRETSVPREACRMRAFKGAVVAGVYVDWVIITPLSFFHVVGVSHDLLGYVPVATASAVRPALYPLPGGLRENLQLKAMRASLGIAETVCYSPGGTLVGRKNRSPMVLSWRPQGIPCAFGQLLPVPIDVPPQLETVLKANGNMLPVRAIVVAAVYIPRGHTNIIPVNSEGLLQGTLTLATLPKDALLGLAVLPAVSTPQARGGPVVKYVDTMEAWQWAAVELYSLVKGPLPNHSSAQVYSTEMGPMVFDEHGIRTHAAEWLTMNQEQFADLPAYKAEGFEAILYGVPGFESGQDMVFTSPFRNEDGSVIRRQLSFLPPASWDGVADAVTFMMQVMTAHTVRKHLLDLLPYENTPGSNAVVNMLIPRSDVLAVFAHLPPQYTMVASAVYSDARRHATHHYDYAIVSWRRAYAGRAPLPIPLAGGRSGMTYSVIRGLDADHRMSGVFRPIPTVAINAAGEWHGAPGELLLVSECGFLCVTRPATTVTALKATRRFLHLPVQSVKLLGFFAAAGRLAAQRYAGTLSAATLVALGPDEWATVLVQAARKSNKEHRFLNQCSKGVLPPINSLAEPQVCSPLGKMPTAADYAMAAPDEDLFIPWWDRYIAKSVAGHLARRAYVRFLLTAPKAQAIFELPLVVSRNHGRKSMVWENAVAMFWPDIQDVPDHIADAIAERIGEHQEALDGPLLDNRDLLLNGTTHAVYIFPSGAALLQHPP